MWFFSKGIPSAWKESSEKKGLKFAAFWFPSLHKQWGWSFCQCGSSCTRIDSALFLWDFLCKQMNIYVELRIIWDKAKFIRGKGRSDEIWKTKMGTNDLISESYWNILEQNMFCKCQRSGIRTRSGGKIKIEDLETQN